MKLPKTLMAGLLALSTAGVSHAAETIHITGSTAFRASTIDSIVNIMAPGTVNGAFVGSGPITKATFVIISGTTAVGGIQVTVKCYWSGSAGGVGLVNGAITAGTGEWLTNTTAMSSVTSVGGTATGGTSIASGSAIYDPPTQADVAMSDVFQVSTPFPTPVLNQTSVGIAAFKWVRNAGAATVTGLNNMSPGLARALFSAGSLPLALWTGVPTDSNTLVYAIGRDGDSGTRITAFSETGFGAFTEPLQYSPTNASGAIVTASVPGPITGQEITPTESLYSGAITFQPGQGGYNSGGDLAAAMTNGGTLATINGYYVTYLGTSDASTATNNGAVEMAWNGVAYGTNTVAQGQYSFWSYEHLDYLPTYSSTDNNGYIIANQIAANIQTNTATFSGLLLSQMAVQRSADGGPIKPIYSTLPTY
jgi:hypothetical protein